MKLVQQYPIDCSQYDLDEFTGVDGTVAGRISSGVTRAITGSVVALITPMLVDGRIDFARLRDLIEFHVLSGTDGIVVAGTTGEASTLSRDEHFSLSRAVIDQTNGRIPVIVSAGANSTTEAIELTRDAQELGADAVLSIVPYYNKPTQQGIYLHFNAVADAVDIPIILYNVPARTGCDMTTETVLRLAQLANVVGIKDATGDIARATDLLLQRPPGFAVYSGDDETALALMLLGGDGVISVAANIAPRAMHDMCTSALLGDLPAARAINSELYELFKSLFVETNPIAVKWAAARLGLIDDGIRLPLTTLSPCHHQTVMNALQRTELLMQRPLSGASKTTSMKLRVGDFHHA
jgi:4-hydroxy-tetrahydrodipicolinate synthase